MSFCDILTHLPVLIECPNDQIYRLLVRRDFRLNFFLFRVFGSVLGDPGSLEPLFKGPL